VGPIADPAVMAVLAQISHSAWDKKTRSGHCLANTLRDHRPDSISVDLSWPDGVDAPRAHPSGAVGWWPLTN
jgi:hypothetical protein